MARFEGFMEEKIKVEVLRNIGILRCYNSEDVRRSVWCDWKMSSSSLHVALEFGGGAELLFNKVKKHDVTLPDSKEPWTMKTLIMWIKDNLLKERPELFIQGDTVRPGILVLVNDADWELLGNLNYQLKEKDNILFISTLHGG